jgi:hypothetical protein
VVQWSLNVPVTSAYIDFGRDANAFEYTAPVDSPSSSGNRTLLLGMKPSATYSFQIVADVGDATCKSDVQQISAGAKLNGLPTVTVTTKLASEVSKGFTLACTNNGGGAAPGGKPSVATTGYALILDSDGDIVWWYSASDCTRVLMSYDGQYLWMGNTNVGGGSGGTLQRVTIDGVTLDSYTSSVPSRHHDFAIMPDESVALIEYDPNDGASGDGCDLVALMNPVTRTKQTVFKVADVAASSSLAQACHSNAINWWPSKNLFTLSVLDWNTILAFDASGKLSWAMGGQLGATYSPGISWSAQHQHHLLANSLLLFNNKGTNGSTALEYSLAGSTQPIFSYSSGSSSNTLGAVQRLPNGNTFVTYSNSGLMHEVNASAQLVRSISTNSLGFTQRRSTLYGSPPPYAE